MIKKKIGSVSDAASLVADYGLDGRGVSLETVKVALEFLKGCGEDASSAKAKFAAGAKVRFPLMKDFE